MHQMQILIRITLAHCVALLPLRAQIDTTENIFNLDTFIITERPIQKPHSVVETEQAFGLKDDLQDALFIDPAVERRVRDGVKSYTIDFYSGASFR
ncbi:MAG: hypothetical protein JW795_24030 [Chitinivibrionales bacterium]|nr:hypothetical protein [Chitinivibrionales bacterium]